MTDPTDAQRLERIAAGIASMSPETAQTLREIAGRTDQARRTLDALYAEAACALNLLDPASTGNGLDLSAELLARDAGAIFWAFNHAANAVPADRRENAAGCAAALAVGSVLDAATDKANLLKRLLNVLAPTLDRYMSVTANPDDAPGPLSGGLH